MLLRFRSISVLWADGQQLKVGSTFRLPAQVLKPGVEDVLSTDLSFLYAFARILEFLNPELARTSLVGVVSDVRKSMLQVILHPVLMSPSFCCMDLRLW